MKRSWIVVGIALMTSVGCGSEPETSGSIAVADGVAGDSGQSLADAIGQDSLAPLDDAGDSDVGTSDAGTVDASLPDTGAADTGAPDTGATDSGVVDAGTPGAGAADAGAKDAAVPDAGSVDTGSPTDAGIVDAGQPDVQDGNATDSGTPDGGTADGVSGDAGAPDVQPDGSSPATCGNLVCEATESSKTCAFDCSATGKLIWPCVQSACVAQTQACQAAQSCVTAVGAALSCADACGALNTSCIATCQQSVSGSTEGLAVLSCGVTKGCISATPGPICGDGKCEGSEKPLTCPADCKPVCGDGLCELPETAITCAQDCKPVFPPCGDGTCAAGETAASCAFDCDAATQKLYSCVKGKCPAQTATCLKQPACQTAVLAGVACALVCKKGDIACLSACASKTAGDAAATAVVSCGLSCFL